MLLSPQRRVVAIVILNVAYLAILILVSDLEKDAGKSKGRFDEEREHNHRERTPENEDDGSLRKGKVKNVRKEYFHIDAVNGPGDYNSTEMKITKAEEIHGSITKISQEDSQNRSQTQVSSILVSNLTKPHTRTHNSDKTINNVTSALRKLLMIIPKVSEFTREKSVQNSTDDIKHSNQQTSEAAELPNVLSNENSDSQRRDIVLDITISGNGVTLKVAGKQVYRSVNQTVAWGRGLAKKHAGLHLVALHQTTGRLLSAEVFTTWQMTTDAAFIRTLNHIQDGRLIIVLGAPDFTLHLGEAATAALGQLGSTYASRLAYGDAWCLVVSKGGGVVAEAITTFVPRQLHSLPEHDVSPLNLHLIILPSLEPRCAWYNHKNMRDRAMFCRSYERYGDFCSCQQLPWSPRPSQHSYILKEIIPVALVTGGRLPWVLRQVSQLWASPGGAATPITIFADGDGAEATALAHLLKVKVIHHHSSMPLGTTRRINAHYKFVLSQVFKIHPRAKHAIIIEDDLDLAPDIIPYFHQTSTLLSEGQNLFCVNAFANNAFPHTAQDPARLYRVHGVPACGWMVAKTIAREMVENWVPDVLNIDWDQWVRQRVLGPRDIIVPEIPRTKHHGGGGVHVTGLEQALYHQQRPLNTHPYVTLHIQRAKLSEYAETHYNAIRRGRVVHLTDHPCKVLPLPTTQVNQSFVVYLYQPDETDKSSKAYYVVARCLGLNDHIRYENLQMMFTTSYYGNQLYVIGCPTSPFCLTKDPKDIYNPALDDVAYASLHPFRKLPYAPRLVFRVPPRSLQEQVTLNNLAQYELEQR